MTTTQHSVTHGPFTVERTQAALTEHGVHLDGHDTPEAREEGTRYILEAMAQSVEA